MRRKMQFSAVATVLSTRPRTGLFLSDTRAWLTSIAVMGLVLASAGNGVSKKTAPEPAGEAVLWRAPVNIQSLDLYYGPGGEARQPIAPFTFLEEDMTGTTPKFNIKAADGTIWMAKLGVEARPEIVASRLVWALGYFADDEYFMPSLRVENMPSLRRAGKAAGKDGAVHNVRLRRRAFDQTMIGTWSWEKGPFSNTREWYGLRVLMAVINNWDLKDENNSVYQVSGPHPEVHYLIGDLGASFGTTGLNRGAKGNLEDYRRSHWLNKVSHGFVDFNVPSVPDLGYCFNLPELRRRMGTIWLGRHIPVSEARWMGSLLAQLSPAQIHGAFRAGGYSPAEADAATEVMESRIRELNHL